MRFLITGATGLVGKSIVNKLLSENHNVSCLIHQKILTFPKKCRVFSGNILNNESLYKATKNVDIIIHCAASINATDPHEFYSINLQGTKNLLRAARKNNVKKFVYFSSWAVNKNGGDYSRSKILAEEEVKKYPNYIIIRPADIYGNQPGHLTNLIKLIKILKVFPIIGNGKYYVSPVYVDDLIKVLLLLIMNLKYNNTTNTVLGPKIYTYKQLVKLVLKKLHLIKIVVYIPNTLIYPIILLLDIFKFNTLINMERYKRLTTPKIIKRPFNYKNTQIKALEFDQALDDFLLKIN